VGTVNLQRPSWRCPRLSLPRRGDRLGDPQPASIRPILKAQSSRIRRWRIRVDRRTDRGTQVRMRLAAGGGRIPTPRSPVETAFSRPPRNQATTSRPG